MKGQEMMHAASGVKDSQGLSRHHPRKSPDRSITGSERWKQLKWKNERS